MNYWITRRPGTGASTATEIWPERPKKEFLDREGVSLIAEPPLSDEMLGYVKVMLGPLYCEPAKGNQARFRSSGAGSIVDNDTERECGTVKTIAAAMNELQHEIDGLEKENTDLHQDAARLDWLEGEMDRESPPYNPQSLFRRNKVITRQEIDAGMNAPKKAHPQ